MKKIVTISAIFLLAACGIEGELDAKNYPVDSEDARRYKAGKITGEEGINLFGKGKSDDDKSGGGIGVNSFLWRATLDTIGFMPIVTADPFGGVITTDWYEDPAAPGERFRVNALILDTKLRSDGVKITIFKQKLEDSIWRDAAVAAETPKQMEDKVLTRARELRVSQLGR